jgi:hypothetical protein
MSDWNRDRAIRAGLKRKRRRIEEEDDWENWDEEKEPEPKEANPQQVEQKS